MTFDERIDEDPTAKSSDTRIRIRDDGDDFVLVREQYRLVEFETESMGDVEQQNSDGGSDGNNSSASDRPSSFERYDWSVDSRFVIHGDTEAKQIAAELERLDAFDAQKLFHRQIWSGDEPPRPPSRDDDA